MAIELNTPIVVPASGERKADKLWVVHMSVGSADPTKPVRATIMVAPYVSSTGEILSKQQKTIMIPDVYAEAAGNQSLATAITAIYAAIQSLVDERNIF